MLAAYIIFVLINNKQVMNSKKNKKKETATLVYKKIGGALADMTTGVKEKKFDKILKKASAALAENLAKAAKKDDVKPAKKAKPEKKSAKKDKKDKKKNAGKKAKKEERYGAPKMNNSPVATEAPALIENITP
jgi:hypothetical protein